MYATSQECKIGQLTIQAWDVGGHRSARRVWQDYFAGTDAIVFLVDAVDRERFAEAKEALHRVLAEDAITHVPILILRNKVDQAHAASEEELRHVLSLCTSGKQPNERHPDERPIELFMCSIVKRFGFGEGLQW